MSVPFHQIGVQSSSPLSCCLGNLPMDIDFALTQETLLTLTYGPTFATIIIVIGLLHHQS